MRAAATGLVVLWMRIMLSSSVVIAMTNTEASSPPQSAASAAFSVALGRIAADVLALSGK